MVAKKKIIYNNICIECINIWNDVHPNLIEKLKDNIVDILSSANCDICNIHCNTLYKLKCCYNHATHYEHMNQILSDIDSYSDDE